MSRVQCFLDAIFFCEKATQHNSLDSNPLSEDLLPGVSVIDLRVVDYSTLRLEWLHGNLKLGLLVKWAQEIWFSLAGRNDKDTKTKTNTYDTN